MFIGVAEVTNGLHAGSKGMGKGMAVTGRVSPGGFATIGPEGDQVKDDLVGGGQVRLDDQPGERMVLSVSVDSVVGRRRVRALGDPRWCGRFGGRTG